MCNEFHLSLGLIYRRWDKPLSMKKRLFGTSNPNKETDGASLPEWFSEIERIDWKQFDYIYNEVVDVISIFKSILTEDPSIAVQSCIQLNCEIEHQDINEVAASAVIPFYIKIINEDSRPAEVLEIVAASIAMLTENITWVREEFEDQNEPKSFEFLNPGFPRSSSGDRDLYNRQSLTLDTLWLSYPSFLQKTRSKKSNSYKAHMIGLMTSLIVCRRAKSPELETPLYEETCIAIFDLLSDATCDERNKTNIISQVMKLAKYDLSLIQRLRDWGKEWADLIWVPRTVAFEIAEFGNGVHASNKELALRRTLSRCGLGAHSEYLPVAESAKIWSEWRKKTTRYETGVHVLPILRKVLKSPY